MGDPGQLDEKERESLGIRERFPKGIIEAIDAFGKSKWLSTVLGEAVVKTYVSIKREEQKYLEQLNPEKRRDWLIERY